MNKLMSVCCLFNFLVEECQENFEIFFIKVSIFNFFYMYYNFLGPYS